MDKLQWAQLKSAVKTLDAGPRKIAKAREEYAEADKYMQEHRRTYSEVGQQNYYKAAREKRDNTINAEVTRMQDAINVVREYRAYPGEVIDLNSAKLMNAVTIINTMGKQLRPDEQLAIAEHFRGEPAALHFLGELFRKNKLYYADYIDGMAAPISEQALENIEYACNSWEGLGRWPDEKLYWTRNAFSEAAARLGFDGDESDPFVTALKSARDGQAPDVQRVLSNAVYQIEHAPGMSDADKIQLFNDATARAQSVRDNAESQEIIRQATTQEAIDLIRAGTVDAEGSEE